MERRGLFAKRIGGRSFGTSTEIYKFEKIKRAKVAARRAFPDMELLDFGVGEPDRMAPEPVRKALCDAVQDPANRGYADNGIAEFRIAAAEYMRQFFGVSDLNPETEINHSIGSKNALAMLPLCFVDPGDVVLTTVPGYPVLGTHTKYLGGEVVPVPLRKENGFIPNLADIPAAKANQAKLFYVNYPNNPTGAAPDESFFDELIQFADKYNVLIVQDAAYATLVYDRKPLSIFSRSGGKETAIELHSMSKSYNMTGWRLAFVAGAAEIVEAFAKIKDDSDSGQFKAIQHAACTAIADTAIAEAIRLHYEKRLRLLVPALQSAGFDAKMPGGTFYLYTAAPKRSGSIAFNSAEEAAEHLITTRLVSTVPWDDAGAFLRFSATFESQGEKDDRRVVDELARRLLDAKLEW